MLLLKCRNLLFLLLLPNLVWGANFNSKDCLMSTYETEIKHEGKFFGLLKQNLKISKDQCLIEINFKKILETTWNIDICREPIHIKLTSNGSQSVYKKKLKNCDDDRDQNDNFCVYWNELKMVIQDHGLIFAEGERETLDTSHGKTFCSYLLLKQYLDNGVVFSKYKEPGDIFEAEDAIKKESCPMPEAARESKTKETQTTTQNTITIEEPSEDPDEEVEIELDEPSSGPF